MLRWIFVLGVVLVGAAWMLDGWALITGADPSAPVQEAGPETTPPADLPDGARGDGMPPRLSVVERPPRRMTEEEISEAAVPGPDRAPQAEEAEGPMAAEIPAGIPALLTRAQALADAGEAEQALALVREGLAEAGSAREIGAIARVMADLEPDPLTRRRMIGLAISGGAVHGDDWDRVGEILRELGHNPRASLYDGLDLVSYTVRPNDSLWKLCNRTLPEEFGIRTEAGLLRMLNGMSGDGLHPGDTLLVPRETLSIEVNRVEHGLVARLGDLPLLAYRIGLGKEGRTPTGQFVVKVKQEQPDWYRGGRRVPYGDPENVLGTRWMGFENTPGASGYGIHGTAKPESVGKNESMGCVRMRNHEVEELFEVVPRGTLVSIP